jgi:Protein kinase domain
MARAEDGSPVAVKVVPSTLANGRELHPILQQREAEIAETLRGNPSDHLVRILDVAKKGKNVLIVMELAEAQLLSVLPNIDASVEVVAILRNVATGLYELHQAGIIHRDLKPGNILLVDGTWKLADFGIARDESIGTADPTFVGWGTSAYMAPEIWDGRSPTVKSDLYALGCVAYELVTGHPPFPGPDAESYRQQHQQAPAPELDAVVNPVLRSLVARLLSKNPADRPLDAGAVLQRLERIATTRTFIDDQLAQLSAVHASERATEAAALAAERAEAERAEGLKRQAMSDLREICEDGWAHLHQSMSDVKFGGEGHRYEFEGEDARLSVEVWKDYRSPVSNDTLVMAGEIFGTNRRLNNWVRLANIVYEEEAGVLRWRVYRFSANGGVARYDLGPRDHDHGLAQSVFSDADERAFMIQRPMHIWHLSDSRFEAWGVSILFVEALALP